ncbi:WSC domain-containing protein [Leptodontidium sp. MPI-SDFR-AT-0119]|nr:WSC domain-containing protein [Leptodontidium sp. MPI-SDFR-AT-0119]
MSASPTKAVGWYAAGCYVDAGGSRTLRYGMQVPGGAGSMTVEACNSVCQDSKYTIAGVEYGGECYCDNSYQNGGGPAPDGNSGCNMPCNGNANETCGGSNRLNVYTYYSGPPSTATSSSSTTAPTSTSSQAPVPTGLPVNWTYSGCYIDNANGRIMMNQQQDNQQQTVESCVNTCAGLGYVVAGMEYGAQCFCDNYIRSGAALAASGSQCGMSCPGNTTEYCGAGGRVSVYNKGNLTVYQPPKPQNSSLPGNWTLKGCLTDNADKRTFPYRITNMVNNNTATNCLSLCSQFGYPAGGMEFGSECCNSDSDCNMACSGDATTICGGPSRISYYAWTGDPLYTWARPTGPAAGEYQFLIGGVVIPLITSQTITGKVTFLEKFGTGAPNTTGAYELDLAQLNNFTAAWRPMHVKSDIFCAGGLTLPDKAGRQINVGGWANDATYGIRLYWPDGSPGVAGKNDWQENVNEVSLQNGRWHPTPMIMANGSILVVGGQQGSNGSPVPTLEILPRAGGVIHCDWLARTDPYNLYPFLAVLPSGGVFVAYYNEARILDEGSLQTARTLPNIPGAVNDFDGGLTYPFEGTAVLLPQHAPYSDPLEVLICGGSTPGPEIALDNCVTLAPETRGANWTIERMPSARVISCMAALPDGTYLILNGGQQGRAGFGLAVNPNRNAVLYDPSKPLHNRMSVMANTTIDRLYHSEAILLQDGRVLVSGSDPEDDRYAPEYRIEVFVPPYLLSGNPQPTFNIVNKDWSYGQSITVTLTSAHSGSIRASLLGAESSTHGNSMGQRTLFPDISCSGNTCTITAPPNAHVCPPGWFMLFILDGPTPSVATFVRIGGDPAGLGNWPNFDDFKPLPGV